MTKYIAIAVLSLALLIPATSNAGRYTFEDSRSGKLIPGKAYLGIKFGQITIDEPVSGSDDVEMENVGFTFAGDINDYLTLEFEFSQTVSEEELDLFNLGPDLKVSSDTLGLFLVGKTQGDIYFKGRVGYTRVEQDISYSGFSISANVYGVAAGLGAGIKLSKGAALEIEYTVYPETDRFEDLGIGFDDGLDTEFVTIGFVWSFE
jgi:opacity protein-like surface antigen